MSPQWASLILSAWFLHWTRLTVCKSFERTLGVNGTCAFSVPNVTLWSGDLANGTCVPVCTQCAWRCNVDAKCTNFNCKDDVGTCEIFYYTPTKCSHQKGCTHFHTNGLVCCEDTDLELFCDYDLNSTATNTSFIHGEYQSLECIALYSGNSTPPISWTDYSGVLVKNATVSNSTSTVTSKILVPGYYPLLGSFKCSAVDQRRGITVSCSTQSVAVKCPQGFVFSTVARTCYRAVTDAALNWTMAADRCQQLYKGAYLVIITSATENSAVGSYLDTQLTSKLDPAIRNFTWLGGQRLPQACSASFYWKPRSGVNIPVNYTTWASGEPNCASYSEFCLTNRQDRAYQWNDNGCDKIFWTLCECGPY